MMLSSALLVVMSIMGAGLCCLYCQQRLDHYRQMASGLGYISQLEKVLELLPQHRGMANTYLSGDQGFLEKMRAVQHSLEQQLGSIDQLHAQSALHPELLTRWQVIRDGWSRLKGEFQTLNAATSFERHSALIGELLYLISDAAGRMRLTRHPEPRLREMIQTSFNLLPPMIENIGQARGIGSGAAAKGTLLTTIRIKLEFLHERLGSHSASAYATLEGGLQQGPLGQIGRERIAATRHQTRHFLETITRHLLGERITISSSDYFSEGSSAFNSNLVLLGEITASLDQQVNGMIPALKSRLRWSITLAVGGAMLLIAAWWSLMLT